MKSAGRVHAPQRHKHILNRVRAVGYVSVPELADDCSVSDMTMRRDLDLLANKKLIERTHGGAAALGGIAKPEIDLVEPAVETRSGQNRLEKSAISKAAAELVFPSQTIALDIGSTTFALADAIAGIPVNVYTNSLNIALHLKSGEPRVYLPPGQVFGSEPSIVGAQAVQHISQLNFDLAFIGVSGVSENGFYDYSLEDSEIKRALISCSQKSVVLIDGSKFNRMSVVRISGFSNIDMIITEREPPENLKKLFNEAGIETLVASAII